MEDCSRFIGNGKCQASFVSPIYKLRASDQAIERINENVNCKA